MLTKRVSANSLEELAEALKRDEVIAFPTETVYGLGVIYDSVKAREALIRAKQRPETKPFTLMIATRQDIDDFAYVYHAHRCLIEHFMPGPVTFIFKRLESVDPMITNGFDTIGIRLPDDAFVCSLIRKVGKPLLVPSANVSGRPACLNSEEVMRELGGRISYVVEGQCGSGQASTIVDLTQPEPRIIRQGKITLEEIKEVMS